MNFSANELLSYPVYNGNDLGIFLRQGGFDAKVWAPSAEEVRMHIYEQSYGGEKIETIALNKVECGCWELHKEGAYKSLFYTIQVKIGGWLNETPGVDARITGVNGRRGLFYDLCQANPSGWKNDKAIACTNAVDAILYEIHIRDFSIAESSGMQNKGKFLAFTENCTTSPQELTTGISHLVELGVTHVHLLPVSDYWTVDELKPLDRYNWGYDPLNYNALEGAYGSKPDCTSRIIEFKKLVMALHKAGIAVVLDVVYNHTGLTARSWFNQTVPGYYYRQNSDGSFSNASGCGNELATERPMVRKYILDSLMYWTDEFHIDGFRFDLMGIIDIDTMRMVREEMDKLRPGIILYGEGWAADASPLDEHHRAIKKNTPQMDHVACFSDDFRDAIKGDNFEAAGQGFVNGKAFAEENIKFGVAAACNHPQIEYGYTSGLRYAWANQPYQVVNYVSCHDNFTLYDKLVASCPDATEEELRKMHMLALSIVLVSQGIPFLHGGSEFCRTKQGEHNSYKSCDNINQIDWERKSQYIEVFQYVSELIALRKSMPSLRMRNSDEIREHLMFSTQYNKQTSCFTIRDYPMELWSTVHVVFNARKRSYIHELPQGGEWSVIVEDHKVDINGLSLVEGNSVVVAPLSMMMLVQA